MLQDLLNTVGLNVAVWLTAGAGIGLIWLARGNRRRVLIAAGVITVMWISGTAPFAHLVLAPLEDRYQAPSLAELQQQNIQRVVVLTGGGYPRSGDLAANALPQASTFRFTAGLELCARLPNCQIIYSGSAGSSNPGLQAAGTMQTLGQALAPQMPMVSESNSNSTLEHPQNVKPLVGAAPFALVTSAYHMPRAMLVFERAGLHAIPFPVNYVSHAAYDWTDLVPSPQNWEALNLALHEYVGLIAYARE